MQKRSDADGSAAKKGDEEEEEEGKEVGGVNWHRPFRGGGMGPLQNEKVRMLVCEGVGFGRDGKVAIGPDAVWRFDDSKAIRVEEDE